MCINECSKNGTLILEYKGKVLECQLVFKTVQFSFRTAVYGDMGIIEIVRRMFWLKLHQTPLSELYLIVNGYSALGNAANPDVLTCEPDVNDLGRRITRYAVPQLTLLNTNHY